MTDFRERTLDLLRGRGALRPRDLDGHGIPRHYLQLLLADGAVERVGRGLYVPVGADLSESHTLAEAGARVPHGVICLLSALRFHGIGTQMPHAVWMALEEKAWQPRVDHPPLRIVRFSGAAWTYGVERHMVEGVPVRVYSSAKTVADCFKYRNKIGVDVAVEALRDSLRHRLATPDELMRAAAACRMTRVMTPYLQALT
ncbi:type IV toxin-antitoxin system AbiEi family antitoxin domain-containing protein [Longimicrobium sp.]|uniref:type IV toxin-antitoxin system AbiEi family antitoxin domain-containing protein n=1 Tax=Longimicrobium sp. TaxID=2029185 RepID=UPI002E3004DB|nr:type IV toxin-antitoxin system AbiEi family antitoxin domain-containing protein [Longimicrobium sp.]HEX6037288.1 type IV toxin-antitoxin system AbiEi family antitoxin domain-containing protein [Longimicrobium sp.]